MEKTLNAYLLLVSFCSSHKAGTPLWHQIFLRGIGCNWLVSIAVWVRTLPLKRSIHSTHPHLLFLSTSKLQEHEKPFQRCTISGLPPRLAIALISFFLNRRSTRFGYLSGFVVQLSYLPVILHAHLASRSSSRVDLTTVTLSHSPANRFAALNTLPVVANMFSVPLGIMFHADVRTHARCPPSQGT